MLLTVDVVTNTLWVTPNSTSAVTTRAADTASSVPAIVDVTTHGHLLGIECDLPETDPVNRERWQRWTNDPETANLIAIDPDGSIYLHLSEHDGGDIRSVQVSALLVHDGGSIAAVGIPRRGNGYEISYPSGNR